MPLFKGKDRILRYVISPTGITLSERHVEAVKNFPMPKKIVEIQRFLGLTNFFRKFIKNYASKAKPLTDLLKKSASFKFDEGCETAFNLLKNELVSAPILSIYNPMLDTEIHTDASAVAIAGILLQKQKSNNWSPVAYYSQCTNGAERNYHSFELKMLAIVKTIERFHIYLYGVDFTVVTDCNAVVHAINKACLNPRIARWILRLQDYTFKTKHRDAPRMAHVDALSRAVCFTETIPLEKELQYRQLTDPFLKRLAEDLEKEDQEKFQLIDGLVFRKDTDKHRFVVPDTMVTNIIRVYHDDMAHCGFEKTYQGLANYYWFPSLRKRIRNHIDNCLICLISNSSPNSREGELQLTDTPKHPFQILHLDQFGPIKESIDGQKYILVVIETFSRFTWLIVVKSTSSKE